MEGGRGGVRARASFRGHVLRLFGAPNRRKHAGAAVEGEELHALVPRLPHHEHRAAVCGRGRASEASGERGGGAGPGIGDAGH